MSIISQLGFRYNGDGTVTFIGKTMKYKKPFEVTVKTEDLDRYNNGMLMQDAFPYLTREQAELLITGYDNEEWNEIFGRKQ